MQGLVAKPRIEAQSFVPSLTQATIPWTISKPVGTMASGGGRVKNTVRTTHCGADAQFSFAKITTRALLGAGHIKRDVPAKPRAPRYCLHETSRPDPPLRRQPCAQLAYCITYLCDLALRQICHGCRWPIPGSAERGRPSAAYEKPLPRATPPAGPGKVARSATQAGLYTRFHTT